MADTEWVVKRFHGLPREVKTAWDVAEEWLNDHKNKFSFRGVSATDDSVTIVGVILG